MNEEVVSARPEWSVINVLELLLDEDVGSMPIIDANHRMVGLVTESVLSGRCLRPAVAVGPSQSAHAAAVHLGGSRGIGRAARRKILAAPRAAYLGCRKPEITGNHQPPTTLASHFGTQKTESTGVLTSRIKSPNGAFAFTAAVCPAHPSLPENGCWQVWKELGTAVRPCKRTDTQKNDTVVFVGKHRRWHYLSKNKQHSRIDSDVFLFKIK